MSNKQREKFAPKVGETVRLNRGGRFAANGSFFDAGTHVVVVAITAYYSGVGYKVVAHNERGFHMAELPLSDLDPLPEPINLQALKWTVENLQTMKGIVRKEFHKPEVSRDLIQADRLHKAEACIAEAEKALTAFLELMEVE